MCGYNWLSVRLRTFKRKASVSFRKFAIAQRALQRQKYFRDVSVSRSEVDMQ
jgi:hypothetical protein